MFIYLANKKSLAEPDPNRGKFQDSDPDPESDLDTNLMYLELYNTSNICHLKLESSRRKTGKCQQLFVLLLLRIL